MRDLTALPKAHLHLHFTGSMRPSTLAELASEQGLRLPTALLDHDPLRVAGTERGWFRFQRLYDAARAVVRSEAAMRRLVDEAVADDAAEGSLRLELQVDPTSYAPYVGGITPAVEIVLDAAAQAARRHGIEVGVVVAASRLRHPLDARTLARLAARYAGTGDGEVVGFGLSNDERRGDTEAFGPAFALARRAGLASVPHGGELLGPTHVEQVLDRLVSAGVALEVCPASNVSLGVFEAAAQVPLRTLVEAGATVALGADDPLLFRSRLVDQYVIARTELGFDDADLAELARGSIRASRAGAASKAAMLTRVESWLAADGTATRA
ncbi:MAG: adenosine deaminase family protein [Actinobacteria bacterium]|nr:adenosine deaminase family protein [Actinomycetota bacterium]